ncbi:polyprenol monophosphomannose synthase [Leptospirillum ferriphilum]|uniref:Dolichol-phosphate mannosyltransferase n=1 Tax=Leptospirillum ferriphilum YSK TaxID=1441628 RepID=A0A059XPI7_9BACT|nr:polyprenol monophosphomannose synthase [Leptospirillum ferriphilum]AIA30489.1 dolichol-phosphate mannosyltransferase [Leptospirillum ferriphilum YSK]
MSPSSLESPGRAPAFSGPLEKPAATLDLLMLIPTYNESENIIGLIERILALSPHWGVLVVDDHSPDGTWALVEEFQKKRSAHVYLLHRYTDRGRGKSGIDGFKKALEMGVPVIGEMDADGSHAPEDLPAMVERLPGVDGVIGSRLVPGGREEGRPFSRTLITRLANLYIRLVLAMPLKDITSGYRIFRREILQDVPWDHLVSQGPSVLQEILYIVFKKGGKLAEVPITFRDRVLGTSTLNSRILRDSLGKILLFRNVYRKVSPLRPEKTR